MTDDPSQRPSLLLVDDDPNAIRLLGRILAAEGTLRFATSGPQALALAQASAPDLIILDAEMPGMGGFRVCEALKALPELASVPVIFVTSHSEPEFEVEGFRIGAADFIAKPVDPRLVLARVRHQLHAKRMADQLRRISAIDVLTDTANRRRFDEALEREHARAQREGTPIALLLADIDHFKAFNDTYGHPGGDACLRSVAKALHDVTRRPADLLARYGGEEFALLLPNTDRAGAEQLAHRALDAVESLAIAHAASPTARHVTISVGVAVLDHDSECWAPAPAALRGTAKPAARASLERLVAAADAALYAAKRAGRAQAWTLDPSDADQPERARDVTAPAAVRTA